MAYWYTNHPLEDLVHDLTHCDGCPLGRIIIDWGKFNHIRSDYLHTSP